VRKNGGGVSYDLEKKTNRIAVLTFVGTAKSEKNRSKRKSKSSNMFADFCDFLNTNQLLHNKASDLRVLYDTWQKKRISNECGYIFKKGKNIGTYCGVKTKNGRFCSRHAIKFSDKDVDSRIVDEKNAKLCDSIDSLPYKVVKKDAKTRVKVFDSLTEVQSEDEIEDECLDMVDDECIDDVEIDDDVVDDSFFEGFDDDGEDDESL